MFDTSFAQLLFVAAGGILLGAGITVFALGWKLEVAAYYVRLAKAIREQADEMLAAAEAHQVRAEALITPTGEYRTVAPTLRQRLGGQWRMWQEQLRETLLPSPGQSWAPGEIAAVAAPAVAAPLRVRRPVHVSRTSWPLRRPIPTPAQLAARLAALSDPDRWIRVRTVR